MDAKTVNAKSKAVSKMKLYAIKSKDGFYYKPRFGDKFWRTELKSAKIYTRKGHASSALTLRLSERAQLMGSMFREKWGKESRVAYEKFVDAEIVEVGDMELTSK